MAHKIYESRNKHYLNVLSNSHNYNKVTADNHVTADHHATAAEQETRRKNVYNSI